MPHTAFHFAQVSGRDVDWRLQRNCSVTPTQLGWMYGALCALSLAIGAWFWYLGARLVLGFTGIELAAVGAALLAYARHAADGEHIHLHDGRLVVELEQGGRLLRAELDRAWVRVEPRADDRSLIRLTARGRSVDVGRYVRPELRPALASEIRMALRSI
ncbi:DUF2244 domain-containing protein [Ramlibacter sp. H39-3-26]|uniref:DUF2244 domain-containing protein n=1 Tax=Curvibacter soli TaxID=3031331 RepID=UPI0023DA7174|nr:DUF2244 domain-containing protein [Ramlibacter sp. H39-3-26]MDF1484834.1 DUF2244 domain-containing protein [Ramlibacter sp. H39-3-26]